MSDRPEILRELAERRSQLQARGIRSLAVFGSIARNDYRPDSDVDLLVEYDPESRFDLFDLVILTEELEGVLGRKVQVVSKTSLRPLMRNEILHDAVDVF